MNARCGSGSIPWTRNLVLASREWLADVNEGDVVLFIDYFGFPCDAECARAAKQRGAWVLEDACQALLSKHVGAAADYVIYSPRKFLGVPDGGVLLANRGVPLTLAVEASAPDAWLLKALEAGIQRRELTGTAESVAGSSCFRKSKRGRRSAPSR